jgi:Zn-dependent M16 (insulinase) family peptidase
MKTILKYFSALIVFAFIVNCSRITEKVEQKVNEKVNEKIDEELKKVDSSLDRNKIDSLMKSMDSLKSKADSMFNESKEKPKRSR